MDFFLNIDFEGHVALVAQIDEDGRAGPSLGGGRYIVVRPGKAEVACTVVDTYQGLGIGTILMRHPVKLARDASLKELTARCCPRTPLFESSQGVRLPHRFRSAKRRAPSNVAAGLS